MITTIVLVGLAFVAVVVLLYSVVLYNGLVELSRNADKAWANISVLLKQRHDEIPKLIRICEGYMQYERQTLEKLTAARTGCLNATGVAESAQQENQLSGLLKNVFAVAENYPDLKANQSFAQLQQRVSYLESQLADRREFYNDSVNSFNVRLHQVPDMWVASMMRLQDKEMFHVAEQDKQDVAIDFILPK